MKVVRHDGSVPDRYSPEQPFNGRIAARGDPALPERENHGSLPPAQGPAPATTCPARSVVGHARLDAGRSALAP